MNSIINMLKIEGDNVLLCCPICNFEFLHLCAPIYECGNDNYETRSGKRGDLIRIPFWCENGHESELWYSFHKGNTFVSVSGGGYTESRLPQVAPNNDVPDSVKLLEIKYKYSAERRYENRAGFEPMTVKQKKYIERICPLDTLEELTRLIGAYWGIGFDEWRKADAMFAIGAMKQ